MEVRRFLVPNPPPASADADGAPIGVLLVNLGTPKEPTPRAVRRFLREFLTDRRIIELPAPLWRLCLEVCILPVRARRSAAKYASVWYPGGSPIMVHSRAQAAALAAALDPPDAYMVRHAMRYGSPPVADALSEFEAAGANRVLVLPMYPQYSGTTVATIFDSVARYFAAHRDQPELRWVRSFPTAPLYIEALARRVEEDWQTAGKPDFAAGDRLLLSCPGTPKAMTDDGDPYPAEGAATAAALRARLGLTGEECQVTFQSRFGPGEWLTPATIDTIRRLGHEGTDRVDVFCPGFVADCLETLEEIDILNREAFLAAGGDWFRRIPCLNEHPAWIEALAGLVNSQTQGWRHSSL
jgi:ferrochelatase